MPSLYDNLLYVNDVPPPASETDGLRAKEAAVAYTHVVDTLADLTTKEKRRQAEADAKRYTALVNLAAANKQMIWSLEHAEATTVASANAARVNNAGTARTAANALLQMPNLGRASAARERAIRAKIIAEKSGGNGTIGYVKTIAGELDQPADIPPGGLSGTDVMIGWIEQDTGMKVGSKELDAALEGAPDLAASLARYKQVADGEQSARTSLGQSLVGYNEVERGIQKGLGIKELVSLAQKAASDAERGATILAGAPPEEAEKRYREATETTKLYKDMDDSAAKLKERMLGGGADSDPTLRERVAQMIMLPKFREWAKLNGLPQLGQAVFDQNGKLLEYNEGGQDAHAVLLFQYQLGHPEAKGIFGMGRALFNKATGRWLTVPVQTVDVASLKDRDGKFAVVTDPVTGQSRYLKPSDLEEYKKDRGDSPSDVSLLAMPDGSVLVKAGESYFKKGPDGSTWVVAEKPAAEPARTIPAVWFGTDGKPARMARISDFSTPVGVSAIGAADDAAKQEIASKLAASTTTDTPPPPGGAWVMGKERRPVAGDLKYWKLDPSGKVISRPVRVLGTMSDGRAGEFLVDDQGKVLSVVGEEESASVTPGEEIARDQPRTIRDWLREVHARAAGKTAEKLAAERPVSATRVEPEAVVDAEGKRVAPKEEPAAAKPAAVAAKPAAEPASEKESVIARLARRAKEAREAVKYAKAGAAKEEAAKVEAKKAEPAASPVAAPSPTEAQPAPAEPPVRIAPKEKPPEVEEVAEEAAPTATPAAAPSKAKEAPSQRVAPSQAAPSQVAEAPSTQTAETEAQKQTAEGAAPASAPPDDLARAFADRIKAGAERARAAGDARRQAETAAAEQRRSDATAAEADAKIRAAAKRVAATQAGAETRESIGAMKERRAALDTASRAGSPASLDLLSRMEARRERGEALRAMPPGPGGAPSQEGVAPTQNSTPSRADEFKARLDALRQRRAVPSESAATAPLPVE